LKIEKRLVDVEDDQRKGGHVITLRTVNVFWRTAPGGSLLLYD
jgi:hypothetical protein